MIATASGQGRLQRHRIIERPRLTGLLESSKARVLVFVAPAGFGKTTLADQWIASGGRSGAWFRARRSSTDVAALALDIARAGTSVVPGCDERLREHLRAVPAAGENVEVLAEILGEDLGLWPTTAWLVIDEYHEIAGAEPAERLVEALIEGCPIQVVIASRTQPSWATQRLILQGGLFELTQDDLAMRESEVAEVLGDRGAPSPALLRLADGWPAAIGLASVSLAEINDPVQVTERDGVHESLYRFFAEEIFGTFERSVQDGLVTLSFAPVIDRQLAAELLGAEVGDAVCAAALGVGIMVERGTQLELHPLARSFLDERADRAAASARGIAEKCASHYMSRNDWDAALEVITRHSLREALVPTLQAGLDDLLETARISTIEEWCKSATTLGLESPWISLARAEIALRQARFTEAQTHAEAAAVDESEVTFRALCVAGRAAHMASREEEAVELYSRAELVAPTGQDRREAQWCVLACLVDMESPLARERLETMRSGVVRSDPRDVLRSAGVSLAYGFKFGGIDLADADRAYQVLSGVRDASARASYQCLYASALTLAARYDDARSVSESAVELVRRLRIEFALPYALQARAAASGGDRRWTTADRDIDEALKAARISHDAYAQHICLALRIRFLMQQGRYSEALAIDVPTLSNSLPSGIAEAFASRALALASASKIRAAERVIDRIRGLSSAVEPSVLTAAVDAVVALKSRSTDATQKAAELVERAFSSGALDLLVTAYRSNPELLTLLLRHSERRPDVARLLSTANDEDLAKALGRDVDPDDPLSVLSPREREVFAHLEVGLSNAQIAAALFIAESTAKLHVHHVLEKLGYSDRRAIVFQALLNRHTQATSAIEETGEGSGS